MFYTSVETDLFTPQDYALSGLHINVAYRYIVRCTMLLITPAMGLELSNISTALNT